MRTFNYFFLGGILFISMGLISCEKKEIQKESPQSHTEPASPATPKHTNPPPPPPGSPQSQCPPKEIYDQTVTSIDEDFACDSNDFNDEENK